MKFQPSMIRAENYYLNHLVQWWTFIVPEITKNLHDKDFRDLKLSITGKVLVRTFLKKVQLIKKNVVNRITTKWVPKL